MHHSVSTPSSLASVQRAWRASVLVKLSVTKDHTSAVKTIRSNAWSVSLVAKVVILFYCLFLYFTESRISSVLQRLKCGAFEIFKLLELPLCSKAATNFPMSRQKNMKRRMPRFKRIIKITLHFGIKTEYRSSRLQSNRPFNHPTGYWRTTWNSYFQHGSLLCGDSLSLHRGSPFTTKDQDNDSYSRNCAVEAKGAWWYWGCRHSNLNGLYHHGQHSNADGVYWYHWKGHRYSAKRAEMKIRPVKF